MDKVKKEKKKKKERVLISSEAGWKFLPLDFFPSAEKTA